MSKSPICHLKILHKFNNEHSLTSFLTNVVFFFMDESKPLKKLSFGRLPVNEWRKKHSQLINRTEVINGEEGDATMINPFENTLLSKVYNSKITAALASTKSGAIACFLRNFI